MTRASITAFLLLQAVFASACNNNTITVTEISGNGIDDESGEFCAEFTLTREEAQKYFNSAEEVSIKEIHDEYPYLPCFVTGKATLDQKMCEWEIRAGGTSHLRCGGQSVLMACRDCLPNP